MIERDHIKPNVTHVVGDEHKLYFNGCFDVLMYFAPLDVHWVRYFNEGEDGNSMEMVVVTNESAQQLLDQTDLPYKVRESVFEREHEKLVEVLGKWATDEMFDLDIDEATIYEQLKDWDGRDIE